jgi:hypothetical protein
MKWKLFHQASDKGNYSGLTRQLGLNLASPAHRVNNGRSSPDVYFVSTGYIWLTCQLVVFWAFKWTFAISKLGELLANEAVSGWILYNYR